MHSLIYDTITRLRAHPQAANISDLHAGVGFSPNVRIDGAIFDLASVAGFEDTRTLSTDDIKAFLTEAKADLDKLNGERACVDLSLEHEETGPTRIHAFRDSHGLRVAIRLLRGEIPSFESLRLPAVIRSFPERENGLILFTGATGMGKSTAIAALIEEINANKRWMIYTLEEPIEYAHRSKLSCISQMELGREVPSYEIALDSMLRKDPDVVLVGEMRSTETMRATLRLAETGHLVFSTLHDNGAANSAQRVINSFAAEEQAQIAQTFANVLIAIVSLRLIPALGGEGRVAACEILIATEAIRALIKERKYEQLQNAIESGRDLGMQSLEQDLSRLVDAGYISEAEARAHANRPDAVKPQKVTA
jgi:twitching motility protein PilT